jgi:hypothetical protein
MLSHAWCAPGLAGNDRPLGIFPKRTRHNMFVFNGYLKIRLGKDLDHGQDSDETVLMPPEKRALTVERAAIVDVERRLADKYTEFSADYVAAVVQHVYARFRWSRVRSFIPLLVERRAAEELSLLKSDLAPVAFADLGAASPQTIAV